MFECLLALSGWVLRVDVGTLQWLRVSAFGVRAVRVHIRV